MEKSKRKTKKVLALIDAQNIFYTPKKNGARVDYFRLHKKIARGRQTDLIIYLVSDSLVDQTSFIERLNRFGYICKLKVMYFEGGKAVNTDWDPEIIKDALAMMPEYDTLVLVSGDGGYGKMIDRMIQTGKRVEVMCFEDDFSISLASRVSKVSFLDDSVFMKQASINSN